MTTKLQLVEQPSEPERVAAENLKPGQFLAAGELTTGRPTEVLFTDTYPQSLGRETLIVHRPLGVDYSIASTVGGNRWFDLATEADLAAMHKQAEREQMANELRQLAEMILNPAMPVPQYGISMYASFKTGAEVRAAAEVFSLPVESRKPNAGIQTPEWPQGRKSYEQGVHLHWLTITDEPEPEPERCEVCGESLREIERGTLGHIPGEACAPLAEHYEVRGWKGDGPGTCGIECACGVTYNGFDSLADAKQQLSWHIEDPTGLAYTRADDEPDDPTPIGPREPMHTGAMTDEGLVDETPSGPAMGWDGPCVASLHIPTPGESCLVCDAEGMRYGEHVEVSATAAETCSAQCACGTEVSGFDSLAEAEAELAIHIRDAS